jgi:hypothetical protein
VTSSVVKIYDLLLLSMCFASAEPGFTSHGRSVSGRRRRTSAAFAGYVDAAGNKRMNEYPAAAPIEPIVTESALGGSHLLPATSCWHRIRFDDADDAAAVVCCHTAGGVRREAGECTAQNQRVHKVLHLQRSAA